jgi:hypothetical protein
MRVVPAWYPASAAQRHLQNSENRIGPGQTGGRGPSWRRCGLEMRAITVVGSTGCFRASGGMADALASGASVLRDVGVQVPLRPHSGKRSRTFTVRDLYFQRPFSAPRTEARPLWIPSSSWSLSASLPRGSTVARVQLQRSGPNALGSATAGVASVRATPTVIAAVNPTFVINNVLSIGCAEGTSRRCWLRRRTRRGSRPDCSASSRCSRHRWPACPDRAHRRPRDRRRSPLAWSRR